MKGLDAGHRGRWLPKHTQVPEVGEGAVWAGWQRPRPQHAERLGWGRVTGTKRLHSRWDLVGIWGGWMGGLSGRDPYPRDSREEKAESAGPDGATVPGPRHPIHRMGGKKGGEGRPHPGSQSWPALLPGAGLKTPGKQRGPGRRSGRGRDTDGDRRATAGGWLRLLLLLVLKMPFVPPRTLPMTPIANMY